MSMSLPNSTLPHPPAQPDPAPPPAARERRWLLPVGAGVLAVAAASAGVLIGRHSATPPEDVVAAASPSAEATKAADSAARTLSTPAPTPTSGTGPTAGRHARSGQPAPTTNAAPHASPGTPVDTQPASTTAVCASCGTVESVHSEVRQGQGTGVGAVAGGVVGGLLGNQIGKGNGRAAMTVLGAVGGGLAGNAIEKHQRASTVYVVKVRMDNGTLRSFTRSEAWSVGQRVTVDGSSLQTAVGGSAPAPRERMLQTADRGTAS